MYSHVLLYLSTLTKPTAIRKDAAIVLSTVCYLGVIVGTTPLTRSLPETSEET